MGDDWRSKIDRKIEKDEREAALKREQEEAKRQRELEEKQRQKSQQLIDHQRRFHCNAPGCTVVSSGPDWEREDDPLNDGWIQVTKWDQPRDLYSCDMCHKWYCSPHIHRGICEKCSQNIR